MSYPLFCFGIGCVWGWSAHRDTFNAKDYEDGFNSGYEAGRKNIEQGEQVMDAKKYPIQIDGENLEVTYSDLVEVVERFQAMANDLERQRCRIYGQFSPKEREQLLDAQIEKRINEFKKKTEMAEQQQALEEDELPF